MQIISYRPKNSIIHDLNLRVSFLIFLIFLPSASILCNQILIPFLILFLITSIYLSKISLKYFLSNTKIYLFVGITISLITFILNKEVLLPRTINSLVLGTRFILLIFSGLTFAFTTNPNNIPQILIKLKMPHRIGMLLIVSLRLYPMIMRKIITISHALKARGLNTDLSIFRLREALKISQLMFIPILTSSLEIGSQIGETMIARGYDPYAPITISPKTKLKFIDYLFFFLGTTLFIFSIYFMKY